MQLQTHFQSFGLTWATGLNKEPRCSGRPGEDIWLIEDVVPKLRWESTRLMINKVKTLISHHLGYIHYAGEKAVERFKKFQSQAVGDIYQTF